MQDKTPIQELIHWLEEWNYNEAAYHAKKVFLSKEKEFVVKVWDAAISHHEQEERSPGLAGPRNPLPDKFKFIKSLYGEQNPNKTGY